MIHLEKIHFLHHFPRECHQSASQNFGVVAVLLTPGTEAVKENSMVTIVTFKYFPAGIKRQNNVSKSLIKLKQRCVMQQLGSTVCPLLRNVTGRDSKE